MVFRSLKNFYHIIIKYLQLNLLKQLIINLTQLKRFKKYQKIKSEILTLESKKLL